MKSKADQIRNIITAYAKKANIYTLGSFPNDFNQFLSYVEIVANAKLESEIPTTFAGRKLKCGLLHIPGISEKICVNLNIKIVHVDHPLGTHIDIYSKNQLDMNHEESIFSGFLDHWMGQSLYTTHLSIPQSLKTLNSVIAVIQPLFDNLKKPFEAAFKTQMEIAIPIAQNHHKKYLKSHSIKAAERTQRNKVKSAVCALDPLPKNMTPVAELIRHLNGLLQDPHPGFSSWYSAVYEFSKDLYVEFYHVGIGDDISVKKKIEDINKEWLVEEVMNS
jgi:hypothetical protein